MADHPWPRSWKALGATSGFLDKPRRFGRTAAAAGSVRGLVLIECLGRVRATLVGGVRLSPIRRHANEIWRPQDRARRRAFALRAILRRVAFRHRPHVRKRTAVAAKIIVNRHFISLRRNSLWPRRMRGGQPDDRPASFRGETLRLEHNLAGKPASTFPDHAHLSCESGIWMSPVM